MNRASLNSYELCALPTLNTLATKELGWLNCGVLQEWGGCRCLSRAWQGEELSHLACGTWMIWDTNRLKLWKVCGLVISGSDTCLQVKKAPRYHKQNIWNVSTVNAASCCMTKPWPTRNPKMTVFATWTVSHLLFGVKIGHLRKCFANTECHLCNTLANKLNPEVRTSCFTQ